MSSASKQRSRRVVDASNLKGRRAFTLIEVLIAVAIVAIVLLAIDGVLYGALHLRAKTAQGTDELLPVDRAVTLLKRDLAGIVPASGGLLVGSMNSGNATGLVKGPGTSLSQQISLEIFSSTGVHSDDVPWGDIQKIDYFLQDPTNRNGALGKDLIRSVTRNLLATANDLPEQHSLVKDVQNLQFTFYDGTNWLDTWDSTVNTGVPTAVKVLIQHQVGDSENRTVAPVEFVVPVMSRGTN